MRSLRKSTAVLLVGMLFLTGCSKGYDTYSFNGSESKEDTAKQYNNTVQLSEEDIQAKNNGNAVFEYSDEGYVTTLVGRYSDEKVTDYEGAVASLNGVASLIGLSAGSDFYCVYGETDDDGYTYYTFQQRYGGLTLRYATLRVVIDKDGYTAGLSSSFTPNVGFAKEVDSISAAEAEAVVKKTYPDADLKYYTDATQQIALTYENRTVNCYAVYTSNPDMSMDFDMMYLEHFVAYTGDYLVCIPTGSLDTESSNAYKTDQYFENLQEESYTATVSLGNGTTKTITVPVAYNASDNQYYLADINRKIMVADYYSFEYENYTLNFITSSSNSGWSDNNLLAYYNYILAYDFYASVGLYSIDGFSTPILVTVDMCDSSHTPIDNACFYGINAGWACFGVSSVNNYGDSLDVVGHEFTHGVTKSSMQGSIYANETGAINESYSDIMGNLMEMLTGQTSDTSWLVGETGGTAIRSMSDPSAYQQPEFVGDTYYMPCADVPDASGNDYGGVHVNNSLASSVAYRLYEAGMSLKDESSLWVTSIELLTPRADFDDLYACLIFSARINNLAGYEDTITQTFNELGLFGDRVENALSAVKDGCGRITFSVSNALKQTGSSVYFIDVSTNSIANWTCADTNGTVSALIPEGEYYIAFLYMESGSGTVYGYQSGSWIKGKKYTPVSIKASDSITIANIQ